jgi:hypothetical protein
MKALSFILKTYKNSRKIVEQRPKGRLRSSIVEGNMGKFESQICLF